jgi:hypothetical protein
MCVMMMLVLGLPMVLRAQAIDTVSFDQVVRTLPDPNTGDRGSAKLLQTTGSALMKRSAIFADLVTALARRSDLTLTLRPASLRGWLGLGRYQVINGRMHGVMTVNPYPENRGLREQALAHELAHAFEIVCLLDSDGAAWRERLAERASRITSAAGWAGSFETPFADAIETAVAREAGRPHAKSVPFITIVRRYGLGECQLAATDEQLAQR